MVLTIEASPVPLTISDEGVIRITGTRVTLDTVIFAFEEGATAEEIALRYPTLRLVDIYAVITYFLNHQVEVKKYLKQERELDDEIRSKNEARNNVTGIRERLLARRVAQERQS